MILNTKEREIALAKMKEASSVFYAQATRIGVHPFIEFCGLMNEYIKACEDAHAQGIDFSEFNTHSGKQLPLKSYMIDYINEKLECIFTGRLVMQKALRSTGKERQKVGKTMPSTKRSPHRGIGH
jgi:hypothetical protein